MEIMWASQKSVHFSVLLMM